jgi:hypothetical protein
MTDPSAEASLPTPITVQLWSPFSAAERRPDTKIRAEIQTPPTATALSIKRLVFMV